MIVVVIRLFIIKHPLLKQISEREGRALHTAIFRLLSINITILSPCDPLYGYHAFKFFDGRDNLIELT
jgi:hypothetical protein